MLGPLMEALPGVPLPEPGLGLPKELELLFALPLTLPLTLPLKLLLTLPLTLPLALALLPVGVFLEAPAVRC